MKLLPLLILVALAACPAVASAATVSSSGGQIRWDTQPGQEDFANVSADGDSLVFQNNTTQAKLEAGPGCMTDGASYARISCPAAGVQGIAFQFDSGDDRLRTTLPATAPPITVSGGSGDDTVTYAGIGPVTVTLDGLANDGAGHDNVMADVEAVSGTLFSGDRLTAGASGATLAGGAGRDTLTGGAGRDLIDSLDPVECSDLDDSGCEKPAADAVRCKGGKDIVDADSRDTVASDCEVVAVNSTIKLSRRADRFTAFRSGLTILGGRGNDRLATGLWSDTINGGRGNDRIRGGDTSSDLTGGPGRDVIVSSDQFDTINVRDGEVDRVVCGGGRDFVSADKKDKIAKDCRQVSRH